MDIGMGQIWTQQQQKELTVMTKKGLDSLRKY